MNNFKDWLVWPLIGLACVLVAAIGVYTVTFATNGWGGPGDWSSFSAYLDGILNPAVGIVTAILLVQTLRVTRSEANWTRNQIQRQLVVAGMEKKLDSLLFEWNRMMDQPAPTLPSGIIRSGFVTVTSGKTFGDVFLEDAIYIGVTPFSDTTRYLKEYDQWEVASRAILNLLLEFSACCAEYDEYDVNNTVTAFYKRRVQLAFRTLMALKIMHGADNLTVGFHMGSISVAACTLPAAAVSTASMRRVDEGDIG